MIPQPITLGAILHYLSYTNDVKVYCKINEKETLLVFEGVVADIPWTLANCVINLLEDNKPIRAEGDTFIIHIRPPFTDEEEEYYED